MLLLYPRGAFTKLIDVFTEFMNKESLLSFQCRNIFLIHDHNQKH